MGPGTRPTSCGRRTCEEDRCRIPWTRCTHRACRCDRPGTWLGGTASEWCRTELAGRVSRAPADSSTPPARCDPHVTLPHLCPLLLEPNRALTAEEELTAP